MECRGRPRKRGRPATTRIFRPRWRGCSTSTIIRPPTGAWSVDEFGPLNLQPRPGRGWFTARRPRRLRATYRRTQGVRHMFGALDLSSGQLYYRIRDRKRWTEFLAFCKSLRARWPGEKLYLICDNYSVHKRAEVRAWCTANA
ncbi:transposase, partial [Nocardia sp. NPDC004168]|uniref:transposase n=1 Tax=Nocardia sp. NPDC004168 TaxID=3154452 RepID=UPI0033A86546